MATKGAKFDANSWEFTQRIIRIGHNRQVKKYFKDIASNTATSTGRQIIKTSLLIRDNDSALEVMNKMTYFSSYLNNEYTTAYPDGWQIRKGQNIPQLAIVYRDKNKRSRSGNYTIHIPHFNGTRNIKIPNYQKGDYMARWILKDNSHIVVNARNEVEAKKVINRLEFYVKPKFRTPEKPWLTINELAKGTIKKIDVRPVYAEYYPEGKENQLPKWREYL